MGYFMRYIITSDQPITLAQIEAGLRALDPAYAIANIQFDDLGDLMYSDQRLALLEINRPSDDIFEDDLAEFLDLVGDADAPAETRVRAALRAARALVAAEIFWSGTEAEPVLEKVDRLWDWLFAHYDGLLQADNEGFYDAHDLILPRNFTL